MNKPEKNRGGEETTRSSDQDPEISARRARRIAIDFLLRNVGEHLGALLPTSTDPEKDSVWKVPIVYPSTRRVPYVVGDILVCGRTGTILGGSGAEEIKERVRAITAA